MAAEGEGAIRPGSRWRSTVSDVEVIVVKPPSSSVELRCGGAPMALSSNGAGPSGTAPPQDGETLMGKRYQDEASGILVLCTKSGAGELSVGDTPLTMQDTRALPSSD